MPTPQPTNANEKLRKLFNKQFFGIAVLNDNESLSLRTTEQERRKSNYSIRDYQDLIFVIEQYSIKDNKTKDIRIANSDTYGYKAAEKYYIQSYPCVDDEDDNNSNESPVVTSKIIVRRDNDKRLVAAPQIFDIIMRYHLQAGHKKTASTHNLISEKYCNITFAMVKFYIEHCPTCIKHEKDKNRKKKEKGPGKAIISSGFRDRVQMDLINYERDPQIDVNGIIMRYLLVLKDHFTKFVWLRPIQRKDAKFVHHALRCLFHEIGFPLILHSDNGSEFVNKLIESFIEEESNSNTFMVNGAPRTPRVQGSVENINYHVQQCIEKTKDTLRSDDNPCPSWLECIPLTTSALNTTTCHGNDGLTPYRHVYTVDHKLDIHFPNEHTRAYASKNIFNFHKYIADPALKAKIETILKSDQLSVSSGTTSMPPSYIDIASTTKQDSINSEDVDSCPSIEKSINTESLTNNSVVAFHESTNPILDYDWSIVNPEGNTFEIATQFYVTQRSIRLGRKHMVPSLSAVLLLGSDYVLSSSNAMFKIIKGYLNDQQLMANLHHLIDPVDHLLIAQKAYYEYCKNTPNRWWENWLVETFFIMAIISSPMDAKKGIAYLRIPSVNNPTNGNIRNAIPDEIKNVISFAWKNHHYATIVYDLTNGELKVYDGLSNKNPAHGCKIWKNHIDYVIQRCHGQTILQAPNINITFPTTIGGLEFLQEDSFNCGPIACYVIWYYLNNLEAAQCIDTFSDGSVRHVVINKLYEWLLSKQDEIRSPSEYEDLAQCGAISQEENITVNDNDHDNLSELNEQIDYDKEILEQHCAQILLVSEYDGMRRAKKNKDTNSILRRKQNILSSTTNIGDIVSLHVHKKDRQDKIGKNLQAVVYAVSEEKAMGIKAITEHGIISWKHGEKERWIGMEYFHKTTTDLYLPAILAKYRSIILDGKFIPDLVNRVTIQAAYKKTFPPPQECKCKDNCIAECPCKIENRGCTRKCTCKGKCCIPDADIIPFDKLWVEKTLSNAIEDFRKGKRKFSTSNYRFSNDVSNTIEEGVEIVVQEVTNKILANIPVELSLDSSMTDVAPVQGDNNTLKMKEKENTLEEVSCDLSIQNGDNFKDIEELHVKNVTPVIERNGDVSLVLSFGIIKPRDTGLFHKVTNEIFIDGNVRHVVNDEKGFGFSIEIKSKIAFKNGEVQSFTSNEYSDNGDSFYYRVYGYWKRLEIIIDQNRYSISKHNLVTTNEDVPISEMVDFGKEEPKDAFEIWCEKSDKDSKLVRDKIDQYMDAIAEWDVKREEIKQEKSKRKAKSLREILQESESEEDEIMESDEDKIFESVEKEPRRSSRLQKKEQTKNTHQRKSVRTRKPNKRYL